MERVDGQVPQEGRRELMETIEEILREMRERAASDDAGQFEAHKLPRLADRIEAAHRREIEKLRAIVEGLLDAATIECASCNYDCGPNRGDCIREQAIDYLEGRAE